MTERLSRAKIEYEISVLEKHKWITAPEAILQLLSDKDILVDALKEIAQIGDDYGGDEGTPRAMGSIASMTLLDIVEG